MKIDAQNYEEMSAWFACLVRETVPSELLTTKVDPVSCLDRLAARSPAKARAGLAMAIGDMIEATQGWPRDRVAAIDDELVRQGVPSLTAVRLRFSRLIHRVVDRGSIKSDVEYYAIRNVAELAQDSQEPLWNLISAYEERLGG